MTSVARHRRPLRDALKKAVVVLSLLIAPLAQASVLHVCDMMGGTVASDCCCGDAHARPLRDPSASDGCCSVSIELRGPEFAAASVAPSGHPTERTLDDVPPVAVASQALHLAQTSADRPSRARQRAIVVPADGALAPVNPTSPAP
jgi:hypothetical protein